MFLQFELWKDCKHGCPCCYNQGIPFVRDKKEAIRYAVKTLCSDPTKYDSISLIGGEFFDGQIEEPETNLLFYELIGLIAERIQKEEISRGLICTSLMYSDTKEWEKFCNLLVSMEVEHKFLVCTSWDLKYRFNGYTLEAWERNVTELHNNFPRLQLHVEMIMTQALLLSMVQDGFSIKEFETKWRCRVDFNTPYMPFVGHRDKVEMEASLPSFFPKRSTFLRFLAKAAVTKDVDLTKLQNVGLHSSCLHHSMNDLDWLVLNSRQDRKHTCVRPGPCQGKCCGYIDSSIKMHEDIRFFLDSSA